MIQMARLPPSTSTTSPNGTRLAGIAEPQTDLVTHRRRRLTALAVGLALASLALSAAPVLGHQPAPSIAATTFGPTGVLAREVSTTVTGTRVIRLPITASAVALHWQGAAEAAITLALAAEPGAFGDESPPSSIWGGTARYAPTAGANASLTVSARSIAFVTSRGPTRGAVKIYLDGVLVRTVDLYAASASYRWVSFSQIWSSIGTHTIKVVLVGTAGRPRVDLDAFEVVR